MSKEQCLWCQRIVSRSILRPEEAVLGLAPSFETYSEAALGLKPVLTSPTFSRLSDERHNRSRSLRKSNARHEIGWQWHSGHSAWALCLSDNQIGCYIYRGERPGVDPNLLPNQVAGLFRNSSGSSHFLHIDTDTCASWIEAPRARKRLSIRAAFRPTETIADRLPLRANCYIIQLVQSGCRAVVGSHTAIPLITARERSGLMPPIFLITNVVSHHAERSPTSTFRLGPH